MEKHKNIIVKLTIYILALNIIPVILTFITDNYDFLGIFNIFGFLLLLLYTNIKAGALVKYKYKNHDIEKIKIKKEEVKILWLAVALQLLITILCVIYIY